MFIPRNDFDEPETIFAIHNAKMVEAGQEVLSERSELRNLTLKDVEDEGGEVLSINIHEMNILLSNLTLKDIEKET